MKKLLLIAAVTLVMGACIGKSKKANEPIVLTAVEVGIAPGNIAPEFALKDLDGRIVMLSSLKGKVTVLDFWGSWCIWCIRGVPDMKAVWEKYGNDLQIVGIACKDSDEAWRAAIAEHGMHWIQLFNGEGDLDATGVYRIEGYPTKIILDKNLKVIEVFLGETPEFYAKLDEVMAQAAQ